MLRGSVNGGAENEASLILRAVAISWGRRWIIRIMGLINSMPATSNRLQKQAPMLFDNYFSAISFMVASAFSNEPRRLAILASLAA